MPRSRTGLPSPRLTVRDAPAAAVAGIVQRPGRAGLTMLGTVLGVGAFVAVLGLTATGAGQISHQFTVLEDTTVTVEDNGPVVATRIGAAQAVARQAAAAERPADPSRLVVTSPPNPQNLQGEVSGDLAGLYLVLASISLLIGAVGIANTTLVAVLERTEEIGLRRAVGARPRHIAAQFLAESTALGTLGGLIGTCIGVGTVVIFAAAKEWTAVLNPAYTLPAPLIGSVVGLLAGAYPALRAARTSPLAALRHA
jgi:putative ABC transport system permease protein